MDRKTLDKLQAEIRRARRSPQKGSDLERLATLAERVMVPGGNHPMWKTDRFPHRPFPIGRHGGDPEVTHHVRKVILDHLEDDAMAHEMELNKSEEDGGDEDDRD